MSDFNSSLPIRTEVNGDVAVKIVDGTVTSQALAVDASGRISTKLLDGAGTAVTSQANGSQRALDVGINVAGVQIDPRDVRALTNADVVTVEQGAASNAAGAWFVQITDGTNVGSLTALGELKVSVTQPLPAGTNNIGKVSIQDSTGSAFTQLNPLPVSISDSIAGSTEILEHKQASAIAAAASDSHSYAVSSGKTLSLQKIAASGSGKIKVEIKMGATGSETTKVVLFNSTSSPNVEYAFGSPQKLADTDSIVVVVTNLDKQAQDLYSTIEGYEV